MKHLHKMRDLVEKRLDEMPGVTYPKLEGIYLMFPRFDYFMTSDELDEYLLKEAKVRLTSGSRYGSRGEGHMRILIATSEVIMNEALDRIQKALGKLN